MTSTLDRLRSRGHKRDAEIDGSDPLAAENGARSLSPDGDRDYLPWHSPGSS